MLKWLSDDIYFMLIAGWSFTKMCNLKCIHCYAESGRKIEGEMSLKEAIWIADKLKSEGVVAVNFGGGECPLKKEFIPLCDYLKNSLDMKISLTTNGTTYKIYEKHLDLFHDIGVSIDFADPEKHNSFRGVEGTFKKSTQTIKNLAENGIENEIVTCVTKMNADIPTLEKIHNLAKSLEADSWRINRYRPTGRKEMIEKLKLDKNTLKRVYEYFASLGGSISIPDPVFRSFSGRPGAFPGCPCGTYSFRIHPNGEVSPCVYLKESGGNIKTASIKEIMESPVFKSIRNREPMGKCKDCSSYEHCKGGCAGASYFEHGHFHGPDPLCWLESSDKKPNVKIAIPDKWNVHELYLCTVYVDIK